MKRILPLLLLAGCTHTPDTGLAVAPQIPELPANLAERAKPLPKLVDPTMGALVLDGTAADQQYNAVGHRNNKLIDLYNCVRDAINNKKEIKCL